MNELRLIVYWSRYKVEIFSDYVRYVVVNRHVMGRQLLPQLICTSGVQPEFWYQLIMNQTCYNVDIVTGISHE